MSVIFPINFYILLNFHKFFEDLVFQMQHLVEESEINMKEMVGRVAPDTMAEIVREIRFGDIVKEAVALEHERSIDLVIAAPHRPRRRWLKETHHLVRDLVNKSACETMVVR